MSRLDDIYDDLHEYVRELERENERLRDELAHPRCKVPARKEPTLKERYVATRLQLLTQQGGRVEP